jgi:hypothetical protein
MGRGTKAKSLKLRFFAFFFLSFHTQASLALSIKRKSPTLRVRLLAL